MSMSVALTHPFIENDTLSKPFFEKLPKKVAEMKIRSRVVPRMNRRQVGVGLLRTINPVPFDVNNEEHRKAWATFFVSGKWTMHFILEQPWDSIPQMVQDKVLAQLAEQIGPLPVKRAPIKLVNDEVVPNVPETDDEYQYLNPNHTDISHTETRTLSGEVFYMVEPKARKT